MIGHKCVPPSKDSLYSAMVFDVRDWARNKTDAWLYGIIVGWDSSLNEVAKQHHWSEENVSRLRKLHKEFRSLKPPKKVSKITVDK